MYGSQAKCTKLRAGAQTPSLFTSLKYCYAVEGQGLDSEVLKVGVTAYAIQSDNLKGTSSDVPSEVWQLVTNQTGQ